MTTNLTNVIINYCDAHKNNLYKKTLKFPNSSPQTGNHKVLRGLFSLKKGKKKEGKKKLTASSSRASKEQVHTR